MIGVAIKNTIIVILLILIIHFLIKTLSPSPSTLSKESLEPPHPKILSHPVFPPGYQEQEIGISLDDAFRDENIADKKETFANKQDKPNTCDPKLDSPHDDSKPVKSECVLDQPNPNAFLLLKQYDNENPMNNTKWIDNVNLYDEFGDRFSQYSCGDENTYK